jgi:DNA (cytosine-5)-methyltransferase 1
MSVLRIGTDCSGIEAPIEALRQLEIPHKHIWSSDIDKFVIRSIKANYEPEILFGDPDGPYPDGDMTKRDNSILPDIDLYVAGFPCQPFSAAGKQKGFSDKRGNVFWGCLDVIKTKRPKYFILENVRGLLWNDKENKKDKYGRTWNTIWRELQGLEEYGYYVDWKVLNTRDYGIPQNRPRVFMVGKLGGDFLWPVPTEMDNIRDYVDWEDTDKSQEPPPRIAPHISTRYRNAIFIDASFSKAVFPNASKWCSCILAKSEIWCVPLGRRATLLELQKLQGFQTFTLATSPFQLKKQIGNSMSVIVVSAIINEILV